MKNEKQNMLVFFNPLSIELSLFINKKGVGKQLVLIRELLKWFTTNYAMSDALQNVDMYDFPRVHVSK